MTYFCLPRIHCIPWCPISVPPIHSLYAALNPTIARYVSHTHTNIWTNWAKNQSLCHFVLYSVLELMFLFILRMSVGSQLWAKFKCRHLKHTPIRHARYQMAILCMVVYLSVFYFSSDRRRLHIINSVWRYKAPLRDRHMRCTLFYSDCIGPEAIQQAAY